MNEQPAPGMKAIAPGARAPGAMAFPDGAPASAARRRYAVFLVFAVLFVIFSGAEVKSRQAGLSVPDWPLSYGKLWPPMVGNVFYEHGHRTLAATSGLLVTILALWTARTERRRWVRTLAWWALVAVSAQGLLGGLTVIHLLPPALSISHGVLAQSLLCLLTWIAYTLSREWAAPRFRVAIPAEQATGGARATDAPSRALRAAAWAAGAVYVQLLLGALMRHNEAGLAVPFFPTSPEGAWVPPIVDHLVVMHMLHRAFAVVVVGTVLLAAWRVSRAWRHLRAHVIALAALVGVQVLLGAIIIWTAQRDPASLTAWIKMPVPASLHVLLGAGLLAIAWLLVLRCWRAGRPSR